MTAERTILAEVTTSLNALSGVFLLLGHGGPAADLADAAMAAHAQPVRVDAHPDARAGKRARRVVHPVDRNRSGRETQNAGKVPALCGGGGSGAGRRQAPPRSAPPATGQRPAGVT